jgi:hypothetical protein
VSGFPTRKFVIWLLVILLFMWAPTLSSLLAQAIANWVGCTIYMGSARPCPVGGMDWGQLLYLMDYRSWLILFTLPLGCIALAVWLVLLAISIVRHLRTRALELPN